MGLQPSKAKLVYELVGHGNVEGIVALHRDGASLEWRAAIHGRTPLIRACRREELWHVAKALIDLGADVDAQEIRSPVGSALHHAARRGLQRTVDLLLFCGANALLVDDNLMTPLDLARECGHVGIVRAIENHVCLFSGWLLEVTAPKPEGRNNIWAVVLPCDRRNPAKIKLLTYSHWQVALPLAVIELWKFKIIEPDFNGPDPALVVVHKSQRAQFKFLPARDGDEQQLMHLYHACRGMRQAVGIRFSAFPTVQATMRPSSFPSDAAIPSAVPTSAPMLLVPDDAELAVPNHLAASAPRLVTDDCRDHRMAAIDTAIQTRVLEEGKPPISSSATVSSTSARDGSSCAPIRHHRDVADAGDHNIDHRLPVAGDVYRQGIGGTIHGLGSSLPCVVCLDAPIEGACIPCGHIAGCMACLSEIRTKGCGCPLCRVAVERVVRLHAV